MFLDTQIKNNLTNNESQLYLVCNATLKCQTFQASLMLCDKMNCWFRSCWWCFVFLISANIINIINGGKWQVKIHIAYKIICYCHFFSPFLEIIDDCRRDQPPFLWTPSLFPLRWGKQQRLAILCFCKQLITHHSSTLPTITAKRSLIAD